MQEIIIDATNATLGRLASYVAKQALLGKKVIILNAERAIVTGRKKFTIEHYQERKGRGGSSQRGPFFPKAPARIVKRTIRGMLPDYRKGKGREAFKRILCFKGVPKEYKEKKMIKAGKEKHATYMNIDQISKKI
jgi:large subunit ribosomal protein L13